MAIRTHIFTQFTTITTITALDYFYPEITHHYDICTQNFEQMNIKH